MKISELKFEIENGGLEKFADIYSDTDYQKKRILKAISEFEKRCGDNREVMLLSVSGRSEISGNHTDHNNGRVLAGAIDRDVIAICSKRDDGRIFLLSEGYPEQELEISQCAKADNFKKYSSLALLAGTVNGFEKSGYKFGGFDAYITSEVLRGSGISSSAAYEVMLGNILNCLYNGGSIDNKKIAEIAQYAENEYFGKPCGLMDQMACAVGGFVYIDFENPSAPVVEPLDFSLNRHGYSLCIVNTGGNHANLNEDYASVPGEMKALARAMNRNTLREICEEEIIKKIPALRESVGDRAILRALHFVRENARVLEIKDALLSDNIEGFFLGIRKSGASSFEYLQNVYTNANVREQGLSLALALADGFLGEDGAFRVHGGGFAGTVQVFVPKNKTESFKSLMDGVFGENSTMILNIRPKGACRLF